MWKVTIHENHYFKDETGTCCTFEHSFSTREKAVDFLETKQGLSQEDDTSWRGTFDDAESKLRLDVEEEVAYLSVRGQLEYDQWDEFPTTDCPPEQIAPAAILPRKKKHMRDLH